MFRHVDLSLIKVQNNIQANELMEENNCIVAISLKTYLI